MACRLARKSAQHMYICEPAAPDVCVAAGCKIHCNREVNARIYGHTVGPVQLLGGEVKPPNEFDALYKLMSALAAETDDHSAAMLGHIDDSGSTLIYRMPIWLYDD